MAKEKFIEHRFEPASLELIETCNAIVDAYRDQGYVLTLRQLYYQLISKDKFPEDRRWTWTGSKWIRDQNGTKNAQPNYKWLGEFVSIARQAGLVDWDMFEDRGRRVSMNSHWDSPASIIRSAADSFRIDRWEGQKNYVETMIEKDALSGIVWPVCSEMDIRFCANKGFSSSSAMYYLARRLTKAHKAGMNIHIIYVGDHDPSGIDMTRDITDRLQLYTRSRVKLNVHRLALNYDQVQMWNPPESPAKETDSRYKTYRDQFGDSCWELDAVEPAILTGLIRDKIVDLIDMSIWAQVEQREEKMRNELQRLSASYGRKMAKRIKTYLNLQGKDDDLA